MKTKATAAYMNFISKYRKKIYSSIIILKTILISIEL